MSVSASRQIASPVFSAFLDVKACLKAVFGWVLGYGKSPCFSCLRFLRLLGPDWLVYNLMVADGVDCLG